MHCRNSQSREASIRKLIRLTGGLLCAICACGALAQHAGHGAAQSGSHGSELLARTKTLPSDDAVLTRAPDQLELRFPEQVRLVKLTLHTENRDWIDIDFRYNPRPDQDFIWQLPGLQQATYYIADWAILGNDDQLVRGSFSFAFGPEAQAPSVTRRAQELILLERAGDPSIRYVAPPPTQIILDQDPRRFDPPFTIELEDDDQN